MDRHGEQLYYSATSAVFTYGSLIFPEIISAVLGREVDGEAAFVLGYSRAALRNKPYPGLREDSRARVRGVLYSGLDDADLQVLDDFEGERYRRVNIVCRTSLGRIARGALYLTNRSFLDELEMHDWCESTFRREHFDFYLARCLEWRTEKIAANS